MSTAPVLPLMVSSRVGWAVEESCRQGGAEERLGGGGAGGRRRVVEWGRAGRR